MAASMMMAEVGSSLKVMGMSRAVPAAGPRPVLEMTQLPIFRVHYRRLEDYLAKVYRMEDFDFLLASGAAPGLVPEYAVNGALPPSDDARRRADAIRAGRRTCDVALVLNVLSLDGLIPAGKYIALITESQMKPTKSGNGSYLELVFQVVDGQYKGRKLWARLNLDNPNPTTAKIAQAQLSSICRATGVMAPKDSLELHNIPIQVSVRCRKRDDTSEIVNEVRGFSKREPAPGQPAQQTDNTPPWARR